MLSEPHRIRIEPDSELARLLEEVGETPVLLEKNGELYRLTREEMSRTAYDPEKVKAAIRSTTGRGADIDADKFFADLAALHEEILAYRGGRPIEMDILDLVREERDDELTGLR